MANTRYRYDPVTFGGQARVFSTLSAEIRKIGVRSEQAVKAAALVVLRQSQIYTPVDTRNLIGSSDVRTGTNGRGLAWAEVFYVAGYAAAVHEMDKTRARKRLPPPKFKKAGARAQFLATALREKQAEALKILAAVMKGPA